MSDDDKAAASRPVRLIGNDGSRYSAPREKVAEALKTGHFRLETDEEQAERVQAEEFGTPGQQALTAVERAAGSATLGLSDVAAAALAPEYAARMEARREENPAAATAGGIAGVVVPGLGLPGLAGKAVKAASLPSQAVTAMGRATAARVLGATGAGLGGRMLAGGAQAAVEGAAYQVGSNITEIALGDPKLTAETLLAGTGRAALLGGGIGMALPAVSVLATKAAAKARASIDKLAGLGLAGFTRGFAAVKGKMAKDIAMRDGPDVAEAFVKASRDPGTEAGLSYREKVLNLSPEVRQAHHKAVYESLGDMIGSVRAAVKKNFSEIRPAEVRVLLDGAKFGEARASAERIGKAMATAVTAMRARPDKYTGSSLIGKLDDIGEHYRARLHDLANIDDTAGLFNFVEDTKRLMDDQVNAYGKRVPPELEDTVAQARTVRDMLRRHLEDPAAYGEAAARQQARNAAASAYIDAETTLGKFFGKKISQQKKWVLDPQKTNAYVNQIGDVRAELKQQALDDFVASSRSLLDEIETSAKAGRVAFDKAGAQSLLAKSGAVQSEAADVLAPAARLRAMANAPFVTGVLPAAVGGVVAGPFGAAAGVLAGAARDPREAVRILMAVEGMALRHVPAMTKTAEWAVKGLAGAGERVGGRVAGAVASRVVSLDRGVGEHASEDHDDKREAFRARSQQISGMIADPMATREKLSAGFAKMTDAAPETKLALVEKQMQILDYLHRTAPKDPLAGLGIDPRVGQWVPSDQEISQWQRRVEAANNPKIILAELADGVVSRETVETVRELYPQTFERMRRDIMINAVELQKTLPYSARVNLSLIFDAPTEASLRPASVQRMQANFRAPGPASPKASGRAGHFGAGTMTGVEKRAAK